jgi:hypothetical protein
VNLLVDAVLLCWYLIGSLAEASMSHQTANSLKNCLTLSPISQHYQFHEIIFFSGLAIF